MGTRHLTVIQHRQEYVLAHYGQWDGYLTGQGITVAKFINSRMDLEAFRRACDELKEATPEEIKETWTACGADPDQDFVTMAISDLHAKRYPEFARDTGAGILNLIQLGGRRHQMSLECAGESLFCEWVYVLNLDDELLEIYKGFNREKLEPHERFADLPTETPSHGDTPKYYQVKVLVELPFDLVTTELIEGLDQDLGGES